MILTAAVPPSNVLDWAQPSWLIALTVAPLVWGLLWLGTLARRRALARLADPHFHQTLGARVRGLSRTIRGPVTALTLALIALALARPRWDPQPREVTRQGRDVVFLVDVSRSMLAQDLAPSRLERAKFWIRDLARSIDGDRVALVAFAGAAVVKCPLTTDASFFRLALDELTPDSVPRGGTNIGDALRKVMADIFSSDPQAAGNYRDIILITDGEDHESLPVEAAAAAGRAGVRIIALGVGSDVAGASIPIEDTRGQDRALTFRGQAVQSRQDPQTLAQIATASAGGVYLNVGTGDINLDQVYNDLVRSADQTTTTSAEAMKYTEGFPWLLLAAVVLLLADGLTRERSTSAGSGAVA